MRAPIQASACTHTHTHAHAHTDTRVCARLRMHTRARTTRLRAHTRTRICTHAHVHTCTSIRNQTRAYPRLRTSMPAYARIRRQTHAYAPPYTNELAPIRILYKQARKPAHLCSPKTCVYSHICLQRYTHKFACVQTCNVHSCKDICSIKGLTKLVPSAYGHIVCTQCGATCIVRAFVFLALSSQSLYATINIINCQQHLCTL